MAKNKSSVLVQHLLERINGILSKYISETIADFNGWHKQLTDDLRPLLDPYGLEYVAWRIQAKRQEVAPIELAMFVLIMECKDGKRAKNGLHGKVTSLVATYPKIGTEELGDDCKQYTVDKYILCVHKSHKLRFLELNRQKLSELTEELRKTQEYDDRLLKELAELEEKIQL